MSLRDAATVAFTEAHGFIPSEGLAVRYSVFPHGVRLPATLRFMADENEWVIQTHGDLELAFFAQGVASYCYQYAAHDVTPATCDFAPPCDRHTDDPATLEPCGVWVYDASTGGSFQPVEVGA